MLSIAGNLANPATGRREHLFKPNINSVTRAEMLQCEMLDRVREIAGVLQETNVWELTRSCSEC